jgi:DnaJ-class molecular chaperone
MSVLRKNGNYRFQSTHIMSTEERTAYEILGVVSDVSEADLKKAYRQQSLRVHPDRVGYSTVCYRFIPCSLF